jgi:hypothetical protein
MKMKRYLLKMTQKACDKVYGLCSGFFEGRGAIGMKPSSNTGQGSNLVYTWQLNQGIEDIALRDIQAVASSLIPGFISRMIKRFHAWYSIFYLTDDIYITDNNISIENFSFQGSLPLSGLRILSWIGEDKRVKACISFCRAIRVSCRRIKISILERIGFCFKKAWYAIQIHLTFKILSKLVSATILPGKLASSKINHPRN